MTKKVTITVVESAGSTNEMALKALEEGARQGEAFLADRQEAGRGRRHTDGERRVWFSPAGVNLYLSVVVRPDVPPHRLAPITLAVGASVVERLREKTGVDLWLKWPNDIFVGDRKLGGLLTEGAMGPEGLEGAVVGLGINCNVEEEAFPEELRGRATSLRIETGEKVDRLSLAIAVAEAVVDGARRFEAEGLAGFGERIDALDRLKGRSVDVVNGGSVRQGIVQGIGADGGLQVEFDGDIEEVISGEVRVHEE